MSNARILLMTSHIGVSVCAGCASQNKDLRQFLDANKTEVSSFEYRVGIPDVIRISAPRVLEIDGEVKTIQPDGKVSLRLLGEVKVVGMTAREIALKLTELLRPYYQDPKVQATVVGYHSKKYYVFGQVGSANGGGGIGSDVGGSAKPYTGRDTLLDALADSGLNFIAWRSQVKVIRAHPDEAGRHNITVDVDKMMKSGDTSMNVLLQPGDIVFVPPTPLGWLGLRIQEVLFPFQPVFQAYTTPATVIAANETYQDHNDDEDND